MDYESIDWQELQCCVCCQDFSDHLLPRNLPCGHSICSNCVSWMAKGNMRCPECRQLLQEYDDAEFPINYPLLELSRFAVSYKECEKSPQIDFPKSDTSLVPKKSAGTCPVHNLTLFFMCFSCNVWICRECLDVDHPDPPRGKCYISSAEGAIDKINKSHSNILNNYTDQCKTLRYQWAKRTILFDTGLKHLKHSSQNDKLVNDKDVEDMEMQRVKASEVCSTLEITEESLEEATQKLSGLTAPEEVISVMHLSNAAQSKFEEFSHGEVSEEFPSILKFLLKDKQDIKELVEEGKPVYISNVVEGKPQWGKITIEENQLHIYSLKSGNFPEDGIPFPLETIKKITPKESPVIFLDIGLRGEIKGRVYVRMFGDTPRGRQAVLLCSGEKGPSYRGTQFCKRTYAGTPVISSSSYPVQNGYSGSAVVDDIVHSNEYHRQVREGLFFGYSLGYPGQLGLFSVYLQGSSHTDEQSFGCVEQGLDVLKEIASKYPIIESSIMECGVVVPM